MNEIEQKEIEKMAREIAKRDCYLYDECPKEPKHNCLSQEPAIMLESSKHYITIATWLVNAGYQNCKDKVVLTREEYEKLKQFEHKCFAMGQEIEESCQDGYLDGYEKGKDKIRKETVKKYNDKLVEIIQHLFDIGQIDFKTKIELLKENEKILKQYGVNNG